MSTYHFLNLLQLSTVMDKQGRSQDFLRKGVLTYVRAQLLPRPLTKWKGRSSNYHRERVLNVASELESRFSTEFWDKFLVVF